MNKSKWAYGFGGMFLLAGLLGTCEWFTHDGMLLGIFAVDTVHNLAHLGTGVLGLAAGYMGDKWSRMFLWLLVVGYAVAGFAGLYYGDSPLFGMMPNNYADVAFHMGVAALALYGLKGCCGCGSSCDKG